MLLALPLVLPLILSPRAPIRLPQGKDQNKEGKQAVVGFSTL